MDGVAFLCSWCGVISFVVIVCRVLDLRFWWCVFGGVFSSVVLGVLVLWLFCVPDTCVSAAGSG